MSLCRLLPSLVMATTLIAAPLAAQEKRAPARELGTTSAEARAEFVSAIADVYNIFPDRAMQHFDKALQLDPHYALARAIRASSAPGLTSEQRQAEYAQAVADAASGPNQEVLNVLAWRARDASERRTLLQALVALSPKTATYAYRLAMTESEPATRIAALQKVAGDFPEFAPVHNVLAYMLWDAGDRDGAMREVQQYLKLNPEHPNPHDSYAELLQRSGQYDQALEHYGHAIAKAPDFGEAYAGMAEVYQLTGKQVQARASWKQAIEHEGAASQAQHYTAIAGNYLLEGNRKAALAAIGDAMRVAPPAQQGVGHAFMAMVEATGGSAAAARPHVAEISKDTPGSDRWIGLASVFAGDIDAAKAAAGRAASADEATAHVLNSIVASVGGDVATGQAELKAVPQDDNAAPLAKAFLAQALNRAGRKTEARALRDEVLASDVTFLDDVARARVRKL